MRAFWISLIAFLISQWIVAQHTPPVRNYKAAEYNAHSQNWSIAQDDTGILYFGNSSGLLSYNGNRWRLNPSPNSSIIRSVAYYQGKLYTGAYEDFGYWETGICGDIEYRSLLNLIPDRAIDNEEIWHIIAFKDKLYFQSFSALIVFDGQQMKKISLPGSIMFVQNVRNRLFIQALDYGLYEINDDTTINLLPNSPFFTGKTVTAILPYHDNAMLITTDSDGIFIYENGLIRPWIKNLENYFSEVQINKAIQSAEGKIILGTIRDGLLVFDKKGNLLYHINTLNGLENNTILAIYEDRQSNIWIGMDKGISVINMESDFLVYFDDKGRLGTVYTAAVHDSILYLGTNQGLYYYDQKITKDPQTVLDFKLVKETQGQVWQLIAMQDGVFCGHNNGSFFVRGVVAAKISSVTGGWFTEYLKDSHSKSLLQGTYTGLSVFKEDAQGLRYSHKITGFDQPVKKFVIDDQGYVWANGPNSGLFRLKLNFDFTKVTEVKRYNEEHGIQSKNNLDLNKKGDSILVNINGRYFHYDTSSDNFISEDLSISNDPFIWRSSGNDQWFKVYQDSFVYHSNQSKPKPFYYTLNKDVNSVVTLDEGHAIFCLIEGYGIGGYSSNATFLETGESLYIDGMEVSNGNTCIDFTGNQDINLDYSQNTFRIYFHHTDFQIPTKSYQYKWIGSTEGEWVNIKDPYFVDFANLSSGRHRLKIRSKESGSEDEIRFYVKPPWYKSTIAIIMYIIGFFAFLAFLRMYINRRVAKEKKILERENERLLREHKIEIENDRLTHDNLLKSQELANATLHLIQKNELLLEIKEELKDVRKTGDHTLTSKDFQNLMKMINENMTVQDEKDLFESNFNEVHETFLKKLKMEYPALTPADLKLAAYIKMNLASKEIVPLFNISLRGLENKRYRLRKKMNLPSDANLTEFFNDFT